ncbi:hypothetical protein LTR56_012333 [Elasticomyces elasticus]|nr:hypothetical protein LTR56_012333 [Elasticomyces elasticus]KAK3641289.1 hypothetical protein LTR22_016657 [Elasticomyces elasticus]KAK4922618.1 hypothetical protein LTR49_010145 [Elasticomyces elasticus]KAK5760791.1 hypothetical protein LTS12_009149 [Elasticomyces elasticus]
MHAIRGLRSPAQPILSRSRRPNARYAHSPSTVDTGFILSLPPLPNPATSDPAYQRVLAWYIPEPFLKQVLPQLEAFGKEAVSPQVNESISDAERQQPYIKDRNVWGGKVNRLVTGTGWKELGKFGARNGVVSRGYEDEFGSYRRIVQHAFNYIYSASSAVYSCPVSMTSGAARLLAHQIPNLAPEHPFHEVYRRLIARENNWTSSQWMTERPGGSDVQNSETFAVHSPLPRQENSSLSALNRGEWLVSGYKFFCSATDCDIALMLAKTESGQLSLFLAPTKRTVTLPDGSQGQETNGIHFHRLKNKMGTKELPTAELELRDVRAWRVGSADRGIATIATLLNVTRTHNFITALSCWRRGMAIAKNFARERTTIDQPLWTFPMHLRLLASMEMKFQGLLQLAFFTTSLLSFADHGLPPQSPSYAPLPEPGQQMKVVQRALTAAGKAVICKVACVSLQECQEAMGGVGYMDEPDEPEHNISRLYRDTAANMTWEGTTNVLASEVVRHLLKDDHLQIFSTWVEDAVLAKIIDQDMRTALESSWAFLKLRLSDGHGDRGAALAEGRQLMFSLAWVVTGALLAHDAQRDGNAAACEVARRWILRGEGGVGEYAFPDVVRAGSIGNRQSNRERLNWDCRIVWGVDLPADAATGYRSSPSASSGRPEQVIARLRQKHQDSPYFV